MKILDWLRRAPKQRKQATFVYCPQCGMEQCACDDCFVEDTDLVTYQCTNCETVSRWDFDAPVPLLRATSQPNRVTA